MKVKTQLAQLRAKRGNISYEKISESTGIDSQQLRELESDRAEAIAFSTLAELCAFFQCTPNDLFLIDSEEIEIDNTPPSTEELEEAQEIIKEGFAQESAMPPREAQEIWEEFQAVRAQIGAEMAESESSAPADIEGIKTDA